MTPASISTRDSTPAGFRLYASWKGGFTAICQTFGRKVESRAKSTIDDTQYLLLLGDNLVFVGGEDIN